MSTPNNYIKVTVADSLGSTIHFMETFNDADRVHTAKIVAKAVTEADKLKNARVVLYRRMDDMHATKDCQVVTPCTENGYDHDTSRNTGGALFCRRCKRVM